MTINNARKIEANGPGLSEIKVDGRTLNRMVTLAYVEGELAIDAKSAEMASLPIPAGANGLIKLKDIKIANWKFDKLSQRLNITLFRDGDGVNDINFSRFAGGKGDRSPLPALLIDYNLSATTSSSGTQAGAVVSPRFVYGNFQLAGALQYTSTPEPDRSKIRRLDTTFSFAIPDKGLIARAGDTITAGSQSQRPLRIGGLQIGTDFALRPDLVTNPLPAFEGNVAVPTGLDLIINDRRFSSAELEAGRFQIRNIPVNPGRGDVSVIVKDELGREVVQNARIYVSRDLLAPGLWEGAANVGYIRRRYGQVSNDYRDLVSTFFLRRGFSKSLSFGLSGEAGIGLKNVGAQLETTLFDRALAFSEVRYSKTAENSGFLLRGGIESVGPGVSVRAEAVWPTSGYRDLAAAAGDPLPSKQINTSINFDLRNTIQIQLTGSHQKRAFDPRYPRQTSKVDILRATIRTKLSDRIDLYADGSYTKSDRTNLSVMVGVNIQLGKKRSAQASVTHNGGQTSGQASFGRPDVEPGDLGYGLEGLLGDQSRVSGRLAWRTRFTRLEGQAEYNNGSLAARANARGTIIFAGNTFYARNQTGGSYALVQTGKVGGITVTRENREAGVTDAKGRLLVENLTPLVPVQFDLDPDKLPYDAVARSTYRRVSVSRGGVASVKLDVEAYRSQLVKLVDFNGKPVQVGTRLTAEPSGTEYTVAFDGLFDLNALSGDKSLRIDRAGGGSCAVRLPSFIDQVFDIPELKAECLGLNIARADAGP
ncbi:MAG: fimbria/pilus outer membrane usher protein [Pontixanthobacter sp.]